MGTPVPNSRVENTHPVAGEVITYRLTPEEIAARYGPPIDPEKARQMRNWQQAIRGARKEECGVAEAVENMPENMPENIPTEIKQEITQKITQEIYREMKSHGMLDRDIMRAFGLSVQQLQTLKQQWGISKEETNKNAPVSAENAGQVQKHSDENKTACTALAPREKAVSDQQIDWCVPVINRVAYPALSITASGVRLNSAAGKMFHGIAWVKIGVRDKRVIIAPTGKEGFQVKYDHDGASVKLGGENLVKQLAQRGIQPGRYRLVKNDWAGWWEATTNVE